ncbi:hypothetical protein HYX05_03565 [Candidatus Woesearchaeota archaeon]|nr:hypothetical protein [Candidatus Woesearchaeota archaeon]
MRKIKDNKLIIFSILTLGILIASCGNQTQAKQDAYFCNEDSDCVIKDVHNCCGYYPRCVNNDFTPDIEAVEQECKRSGTASICGFAEISHCECVENKCISMQQDKII